MILDLEGLERLWYHIVNKIEEKSAEVAGQQIAVQEEEPTEENIVLWVEL